MLLLDSQAGSADLALYEPLRSLLSPCPSCGPAPRRRPGKPAPSSCLTCADTGRALVKLPSGDVFFRGWHVDGEPQRIGIEVKRTEDLIQSIDDGRLHAQSTGQLTRMCEDYDRVYLLHYGLYRPGEDGSLQLGRRGSASAVDREVAFYSIGHGAARKYAWLEAFLSGPSFAATGVERVRVQSIEEAAAWISVLYAQWTKDPADHSSMRKVEKHYPPQPPGMDDETYGRLRWAMEFPNMGYARALALATHFPSVRAMVNSSAEEIAKVEVGTKGGAGRKVRIGKAFAEAMVRSVS